MDITLENHSNNTIKASTTYKGVLYVTMYDIESYTKYLPSDITLEDYIKSSFEFRVLNNIGTMYKHRISRQ